MVNINNVFPSKYLSAEDIAGQEYTVTIRNVAMEQFDDGESKAIVHFNELPKGLTLNKTNAKTIASMYGPETDSWNGQKVTVFTIWTEYQGKQTQGIRVRPPAYQAGAIQQQANTQLGQSYAQASGGYSEINPPPPTVNEYAGR